MLLRLSVANYRQAATKLMVLCCGCIGLSFFGSVWFGLHQKLQAAENILPDRQVHAAPTKVQPKLAASYGRLPLSFEANQGQVRGPVKFLSRGRGYTLFLTGGEAVLALRKQGARGRNLDVPAKPTRFDSLDAFLGFFREDGMMRWRDMAAPESARILNSETAAPVPLRLRLMGANSQAKVTGLEELPGKSNYFLGNDPKKWRTNVPTYAKVKYRDVYPGVDLIYYGNQGGRLEYDFVVAPGADPNQIKLSFAGTDGMRVDAASGDLVLKMGEGEVRFQRPAIYQPAVAAGDGRRRGLQSAAPAELDGSFVVANNGQVAFRVAGYDPRRALVIDPVLGYSTYLGGGDSDEANAIAVDSSGNAYVTGFTDSTDFPTADPLQATSAGGMYDAFVTKFDAAGSALVYSTFLGGSGSDNGAGIAVDSSGSAYVTGYTASTDFPTANPFQATKNTSSAHSLFATAFVTKLNPAGSALVYSTYLGGSGGGTENVTGGSTANGIAVDSSGDAYVTGQTYSTDFPTVTPIQLNNNAAEGTVFVTKFNPTGSALLYSTYLGGSVWEGGASIAVDSSGNASVTGWTSSKDFPTVNPIQLSNNAAEGTMFVTKFNPTGSALLYSTYLGGSAWERGIGIAVDSSGNAYVTGYTDSNDFPTLNPILATCGGCDSHSGLHQKAFVTELNAAGSALVYSTYLGGNGIDTGYGIAVDSSGSVYVAGQTTSINFPTVNPVQAATGNMSDAFVAKISPAMATLGPSSLVFALQALGTTSAPQAVTQTITGVGSLLTSSITASGDFAQTNTCGEPLTDSSCAINVTFTPTAAGTRTGSITIANNSSVIPHTVNLSGTGTGISVGFAPTSLTFFAQNVGTNSTAQNLVVTNTGDAALTISSVATSGDFSQVNTCVNSISPGGNCSISITFTPTVAEIRTGTLTLYDNAYNSPQSVAISGEGQDFTLAASSGSSTTATVAPGSSATYTLSSAGENGFYQAVNFACSGVPSEATCTVSPNPVDEESSAANITVKVTTTAPIVVTSRSWRFPLVPPLSPGGGNLLMLAVVLAALAWAAWGWRQPRLRAVWVTLAAGLSLALALAGCGGGGGGHTSITTDPGTPAGTYTLTVTGTAGAGSTTLSHSVTLTLKVS